MALDPRIDKALASSKPLSELRTLVCNLRSHGENTESILALLEASRRELREADREPEEDTILEVMDILVGWCSPHMRLESDEPR
jgi:hypothetical protein